MTLRSGFGRWLAGLAAVICGVAFAGPAFAQPADSPIEGTWRSQNGSEITITPCGKGYCGTLSWVVVIKDYAAMCEKDKAAFGEAMVDANNQDASLRTRKIIGMQMMSLKPTNDPRTFTGSIYNAEDGKTYDGVVWLLNNDTTLRLGGGCLGQICVVTQDWPRVSVRTGDPDFVCRP